MEIVRTPSRSSGLNNKSKRKMMMGKGEEVVKRKNLNEMKKQVLKYRRR
jgi:hypothetical protein